MCDAKRLLAATPEALLTEMLRLGSGYPRKDDAEKAARTFLAPYEAALDVLERLTNHFDNHMEGCRGPYLNEDADMLEQARTALRRLRDEVPA